VRSLQVCFAVLLLATPAFARARDVSGHYERSGDNDQASLDIKRLPGDRVKVSGITQGTRSTARWSSKHR